MGSQFNTALWGGGIPAGLVTVSGRTLVYGALRLLGVLRPGQTPNPDSCNDGLMWLNELLDSWATERLMVKVIGRTSILMSGATSYAALPHRIEAAGYTFSGGVTEQRVEVYGLDKWTAISQKVQSGSPVGLYPEYTVADATVYPWPQAADGELVIYQWQPLEAFGDLDTAYVLPAGYALALRFCLAAQIAPAFLIIAKIPQPLINSIEAKAVEYKGKVKSLNSVVPAMVFDNPFSTGGYFDIWTGEYR